jgi:hypothetical protein
LPPTTILSFTDDELALLRVIAAPLQPEQRDRFLRDVARELGHLMHGATGRGEKIGPGTVGQVATAVQRWLLRTWRAKDDTTSTGTSRGRVRRQAQGGSSPIISSSAKSKSIGTDRRHTVRTSAATST